MTSRSSELLFYIHNPDENNLKGLVDAVSSTPGIEASVTEMPARSFVGDAVFKLVLTVGSGVAVKVVADLLVHWFKTTRQTKIVHEEETLVIERTEITRIVRRKITPPQQ